jgi:hypothetical protein
MTEGVAFIVEGELEKLFIQNVCPGSTVRLLQCNGDNVPMSIVAKKVGSLCRLLQKRHAKIVVLFDREARDEPCDALRADCLRRLRDHEDVSADVIIGIPDRDIETWLLADLEMLRAAIDGLAPSCAPCEGEKGKPRLKHSLPAGMRYVETDHGPRWLKKARPHRISENSQSFRVLAEQLASLHCWWLKTAEEATRVNADDHRGPVVVT